MDVHITRLTAISRDLVAHLSAGDRDAALQSVTALRARLDVIVRELVPVPASDTESGVLHG